MTTLMSTRTSPPLPHAEYFPPDALASEPSRWLDTMRDDAAELRRFWPVLQNMVVQDLRVRYQRSLLGFFWSLLNPILMMAVMTVVFASLLGRGGDWKLYAIFLFSGQLPWMFMAGSLVDSAYSIINNEALIRKIYLPKLIFPLSRVLFHLVMFVLSLTALFVLLIPLGARFTLPLLMLPVAICLFALFVTGMSLFLAVLNTFYRDCGHLIGVVMQAWFFATPILYEADRYKGQPWFLMLNPAFPFIAQFQKIIRYGVWPDPATLLASAILVAASLGVGYAAYKSHEDKLVFRL